MRVTKKEALSLGVPKHLVRVITGPPKVKRTEAQKALYNEKAHRYEKAFAHQLWEAGISFDREFVFAPPRKWRFDFMFDYHVALEIDGGVGDRSRHTNREGFERDLEKRNTACLLGWHVLHVTPRQVKSGEALALVKRALSVFSCTQRESAEIISAT